MRQYIKQIDIRKKDVWVLTIHNKASINRQFMKKFLLQIYYCERNQQG